MEPRFSFKTDYDMTTFTAMARAIRKTVGKKRSRRSHIFGAAVVVLGIAASLLWGPKPLTIAAIALIILVFIFENRINAFFAMKRMLPGMGQARTDFYEDKYTSATDIGTTEWHYDKIKHIAEDKDFFIFFFSKSHVQAYDKSRMYGGIDADFKAFIEEKTGLKVEVI